MTDCLVDGIQLQRLQQLRVKPSPSRMQTGASSDCASSDCAKKNLKCPLTLTEAMEKRIKEALEGGPDEEILVTEFNITLRRLDIKTLKDLSWVNDEVINFYFSLIKKRSEMWIPSVHVFSTFFYPRLLEVGHKGLKRWTRNIDVFSYDLILIPVHSGSHWSLTVVDTRAKSIAYYDSLLGDNHRCVSAVMDYLVAEHLAKTSRKLDVQQWSLLMKKEIPRQYNTADCGIFTCKFADYLSRDKPLDFSYADIPKIRRRMIIEILDKILP